MDFIAQHHAEQLSSFTLPMLEPALKQQNGDSAHALNTAALIVVKKVLGSVRGKHDNQFNHPRRLFVDSRGWLYVSDTGNGRIQIFNAEDESVRQIGNKGNKCGEFDSPHGLFVDKEFLYVADARNHRVQVLRLADGAWIRTIGREGRGDGQFRYPSDLCVDTSRQFLYVTDKWNHRVCVLSVDGAFIRNIGNGHGHAEGHFNYPSAVCIDSNSRVLYVCDTYNHRIQLFHADSGAFIGSIGNLGNNGGLVYPEGMCLDVANQLLYVTDMHVHQVQVLNLVDHVFLTKFGHDGIFKQPCGIGLNSEQQLLYVCDTANHKIQVAQVSIAPSSQSHPLVSDPFSSTQPHQSTANRHMHPHAHQRKSIPSAVDIVQSISNSLSTTLLSTPIRQRQYVGDAAQSMTIQLLHLFKPTRLSLFILIFTTTWLSLLHLMIQYQ